MLNAELVDAGIFGSMPRYGDLSIHGVVDLRRSFSRAEIERAVDATIAAFPVLGRRYELGFWRDRWVKVDGPVSDVVHTVDDPGDLEAETIAWTRRPLVATRDRPLRIVSLRRGEGSRLILSLLHLAVDGAGMAAVGHALGAHLYGVPPSAPLDRRRDVASVLERLRWYHLPVLAKDVATTLLQPLRTRAAAKRDRHFPSSDSRETSFRHLVISAEELAKIRARCGGASVNDALIAALARVSGGRSSGGPVAVLYTMDLRRYMASPRFTTANTSSILTAVVPRGALGDLSRAARAVAAITAGHRRGLAGPAFVLTPLLMGIGSPHAVVRRLVRGIHPVAVDLPLSRGMLVTNVGKIDDGLGALAADIEDLRVIGPNVAGIPIPAVVAFGFRGRLHVELFAPAGVAEEALDELARELRDALELPLGESAKGPGAEPRSPHFAG